MMLFEPIFPRLFQNKRIGSNLRGHIGNIKILKQLLPINSLLSIPGIKKQPTGRGQLQRHILIKTQMISRSQSIKPKLQKRGKIGNHGRRTIVHLLIQIVNIPSKEYDKNPSTNANKYWFSCFITCFRVCFQPNIRNTKATVVRKRYEQKKRVEIEDSSSIRQINGAICQIVKIMYAITTSFQGLMCSSFFRRCIGQLIYVW